MSAPSAQQKALAIRLNLTPMPAISGFKNEPGWDNWANYTTNLTSQSFFVIALKQGATYTFASSSWYDPFQLAVYDANGKVVAEDADNSSYGTDYVFDFKAAYSGDYYVDPSWHQSVASSLKQASVNVYEDVDTIPKPVVVEHGTAGLDAYAIRGTKATALLKISGDTVTVIKGGQANREYVNVERFAFDDGWVASDINGNAGQAYRLYKAAFDRTPDQSGLGFWIKQLDSGASLKAVAQAFVSSKEFGTLYGNQISNKEFVAAVYQNVLDRPLDQTGADFWLNALNNGASRAEILIGFSESPENQKAVIGAIQNGIQYEFWW